MAAYPQDIISELAERISSSMHPEKIYLFGSHAWGIPNASSDIDLLIIIGSSDKPPYQRAREVYRHLRGIRAPVEVVVRTNDEVERSRHVISSLTRRILDNGRLLYG